MDLIRRDIIALGLDCIVKSANENLMPCCGKVCAICHGSESIIVISLWSSGIRDESKV